MKTSARLLAAIAFVAVGVGVMASLSVDRGGGEAAGKPTKSGAHRMRTKSGSPAETMADLRSASRGDLRAWARGLEDGELRLLAMSFLGRLEVSTEPEEWEDRARMREFLAALFMEWGKRDIGGVEAALKGADELTVDLAFPTALAGYSEREPMDALERLLGWTDYDQDIMRESAFVIATFHLAKQDPEAAFELVTNWEGSMEGFAAALSGPGELDPVIDWLGKHLDARPPSQIWSFPDYAGLQEELAIGWARHDLAAAGEYILTAESYTTGDLNRYPQMEVWEKLAIARPQEALDFVVSHYWGKFDYNGNGTNFSLAFDAAFHGALMSDPDGTLTRMIRGNFLPEEHWASMKLTESGIGESDNESMAWPLDDAMLPLPISVRNERIFSRIDEFGWEAEKEDRIKEDIQRSVIDRERYKPRK